MSNKTKRLAKGLGASALAIATIASGLSFGISPASASAPATNTEYAPVIFKAIETSQYVTHDRDPSQLPVLDDSGIFALDNVYAHPVKYSSEAEALKRAPKFRKLTTTWAPLQAQNGKCAAPQTGRSWLAFGDCDDARLDPNARLAPDGTIEFRNFGEPAKLSYIWRDSGRIHWSVLNSIDWFAEPGGEYAQKRLTAEGSFPADNAQRAQITGTAEADAKVVIKMGTVEIGTTQADASGAYTFDVPAPMQGGVKNYTVSQIVDNVESGNAPVELNYGTAVSISSHSDGDDADAGAVKIAGAGENGSSVTVKLNGTDLPATNVAGGTWSVDTEFRRGENTIEVTQKSKGANSTTAKVTVNPGDETTIPFEVTTPANNSTVSGPTVDFTGRAEPGTRVRIVEGTTTVMTNRDADGNGDWSGSSIDLANGVHNLTVQYTEPGQTQQTQPLTISVQNGVVQPFNWETPRDGATVTSTFEVKGTATTGTQVNIIRATANGDVVVMRNVKADAQGNWSGTGTLPAGTRQVKLQYVEPGKNKQTITRTLEVTAGANLPFDWSTPDGTTPVAETFSVTGTAPTGTQVNLIRRTASGAVTVMRTVEADAQGNWSGIGTLPAGTRQVTLQYMEPGKPKQSIDRTLEVTAGATVPFAWTTPDGSTPLAETFSVEGTAPTDTDVNIIRSTASGATVVMKTVKANAQGNWSGIGTMPAGTRQVTLQYIEPGKPKQSINRTLEIEERTVVDFALTSPSDGDTVDSAFEFSGDATTGTKVNVIRQNASGASVVMGTVEANGKGKWSGTANLQSGRTHTVQLQYSEPGKQKKVIEMQLTVR